MRTNTPAGEGKCVSVTFRGQLPSELALHEVRRRAAMLRRADIVHAVVRAAGGGEVEVSLEATLGHQRTHSTAHDKDLLAAIAKAFDKLLVSEAGLASTVALRMAAGSVA
jgi:hypothetical protein